MPLSPADIRPALALWAETADAGPGRLLNRSENETFLIETAGGAFTLRVHRVGYQLREAIESELAWLSAVRLDTGFDVAEPVAGKDGALLQEFVTRAGEARRAVLFRFLPGREPTFADDLVPVFSALGRYAGSFHRHVEHWRPPEWFTRPTWDAASVLDADGLWGDWRTAPDVDDSTRRVLGRLDETLRKRLAAYGTSPDRFGLIHADMRLGNLLVDGDRVSLIDFDDSGYCWFGYDFAAAISFHETEGSIPSLREAWLEAYRAVRPLTGADLDELDSLVMLRRMALLAWIGSHHDTALAQTHRPGFAEGTAALTERYLSGRLWPN